MRGKFTLVVTLLMISLFPEIAVIAPLYSLLDKFHLLNSYQALVIPYAAFFLPFAIWILRNYMISIPKEMEETARIDGAGRSGRCGRSSCRWPCRAPSSLQRRRVRAGTWPRS
jgi:ABC-type glycerol-3-phosphate transport system permease component